jgi:beta-lactamase class A
MRWALLLVMAIAMAWSDGAGAADTARKQALERLFHERPVTPERFTQGFLTKVPASQVEAGITELTARYGDLKEIADGKDKLRIRLERAEIPAWISLSADGRIAGLFFEPPVPTTGGLDEHLAAIAALPGQTSVLVTKEGTTRAAHNPEAVLAVGSTAKLAVLKAANDAVTAGRLAWDRVVRLDPAWRSVPSGILHEWPDGTPLTLATLANLAISLSDNTAADALIHLVGRKAIQAVTPINTPFLTTRELFILKASGNGELRERWHKADGAGRIAMLADLAAQPLPKPSEIDPAPTLAVGWYLSAGEICRLLRATRELPALHINAGPAAVGDWASIAYKGGSEPGVLNLSSRVTAKDGTTHCVVATWNDRAVLQEERLVTPYRAILRLLAGRAE